MNEYISVPAILVSALVMFFLGFMAHGPIGGQLWMRLAGIKMPENPPKFSGMIGQMVANYAMNVQSTFVMCGFYISMGALGMAQALWIAGLVWLVSVSATSMEPIWMGRKMPHFLFEVVSSFINLMAAGAVIAWMV